MRRFGWMLGLVTAAVLGGCEAKSHNRLGGETNWLTACDSSADCNGDADCLCGVCTMACESGSDACSGDFEGSCVPTRSGVGEDLCAPYADNPVDLCLPDCDADGVCGDGFACNDGQCVPAVAVATAADAGARVVEGPDPACLDQLSERIPLHPVDKVDMLFVVDNSGGMRQEQIALRDQFPKLITSLATGMRPGGTAFAPVEALHLGVVSSDMGLVGVHGIPGCIDLGDDGVLRHDPSPFIQGCQRTYPSFLTFTPDVDDPEHTALDLACITTLGTEGCGFEQPLEAGLKALWPSQDRDRETGEIREPNRILFLADENGVGQLGHGDTVNRGFMHDDPVLGTSLVSIVFVSDEEDCSSADTRHFTPDLFLEPGDPLIDQDLNLRCFLNKENLYAVERYVKGLKALRPGQEQLVVFGAIVGVPPDLVDETARAGVNFADPTEAGSYYANILDDPRMQEVPDPAQPPGEGNLTPSCITNMGRAYPPRRFVEVAEQFGDSGVVQSICQEDFSGPMDAILDSMVLRLGGDCRDPEPRNADGRVDCELLWELSPPGLVPANVPTDCTAPFLTRVGVGDGGGELCRVNQVPVEAGALGTGEGWYQDDFSDDTSTRCPGSDSARIAFTPDARPPNQGLKIRLACPAAGDYVCD